MEKFRELEKQLIEHKATLEKKVAERNDELQNLCSQLEASKEKVARLQQIVSTQEISVEDVKKMESERAALDENIEKLAAEKMSYNKQIWENEMELSRRFEQLSVAVHDYNVNAKKLGIIPADAVNANGKDFSMKLERRLVFDGSRNIFSGRDVEEILNDLMTLKNDLLKQEADSREHMMEALDLEDASEALLIEKDDEIKVSML